MRTSVLLFVACFAFLNGVSCREGSIINPKTGPGTEYPCGVQGVSCGNGMCCGLNEVCGRDEPFSTCRAGYCCYAGDSWPRVSASPDAGLPLSRPQFHE